MRIHHKMFGDRSQRQRRREIQPMMIADPTATTPNVIESLGSVPPVLGSPPLLRQQTCSPSPMRRSCWKIRRSVNRSTIATFGGS
jgi:hypothetical protein